MLKTDIWERGNFALTCYSFKVCGWPMRAHFRLDFQARTRLFIYQVGMFCPEVEEQTRLQHSLSLSVKFL